MNTQVIELELARETKNTLRYEEVGDGPPMISTVYVQKWAVPDRPRRIKVTIEAA